MVEFSLKPIIMFFVVVILGVVFLGEIADNQVENTELSFVTNETITITVSTFTTINESITITNGEGAVATGPIFSVSFFGNATNSTDDAGISLGTEVNFSRSGAVAISQEADKFGPTGTYNISYVSATSGTGVTANNAKTAVSFFGNGSISTGISGIEIGDEINFTKASKTVTVSSYNFSTGDHNISYTHEGDLYVVDTKTHPLLKLLAIFFVLVIFAFGIQAIRESSDDFNFGFK